MPEALPAAMLAISPPCCGIADGGAAQWARSWLHGTATGEGNAVFLAAHLPVPCWPRESCCDVTLITRRRPGARPPAALAQHRIRTASTCAAQEHALR